VGTARLFATERGDNIVQAAGTVGATLLARPFLHLAGLNLPGEN
jgi:hypothetical protein